MNTKTFIALVHQSPNSVTFQQTMDVIAQNYIYTPTAFTNGEVTNPAGSNEGSCKLFAFAQNHKLTQEQTLACFGDYYRKDVLENPTGSDHANIRSFMVTGWDGIVFEGVALSQKSVS